MHGEEHSSCYGTLFTSLGNLALNRYTKCNVSWFLGQIGQVWCNLWHNDGRGRGRECLTFRRCPLVTGGGLLCGYATEGTSLAVLLYWGRLVTLTVVGRVASVQVGLGIW